jgi:integrase
VHITRSSSFTCSAHGLRKACARRLGKAGARGHDILAVTGHKTLAEVQRYTDSALREGLDDSAFESDLHAKIANKPW